MGALFFSRLLRSELKLLDGVACFAALTTLTLTWYLLYRYTCNIPNADDFDMYLGSVRDLESATSWSSWCAVLFARHGEHFIVTTKLFALGLAHLVGEINFRAVIFVGNAGVLLAWLSLCALAERGERCVVAGMLGVLLFSPLYTQASLWAAAGIEHLWVMVFALGALLLERSSKQWRSLPQIMLATLAALTQGNGIFTTLALSMVSLLRRSYWRCVGWGSIFLLSSLVHVLLGSGAILSGEGRVKVLWRVVPYVLGFLGGPFAPTFWSGVGVGAVGVLCAVPLYQMSRNPARPLLAGIVAFTLATACANALARIQFGLEYGFSESRYAYPALFFWCALLILAAPLIAAPTLSGGAPGAARLISPPWPRVARSWMALGAVLLFAFVAFVGNLGEFQVRRDFLQDSVLLQNLSVNGLQYPDQERARELLHYAEQRGFYTLPRSQEVLANPLPLVGTPEGVEAQGVVQSVEHYVAENGVLLISGYLLQRDERGKFQEPDGVRLFAVGEGGAFELPLRMRARPDVRRHHRIQWSFVRRSGFFSYVAYSGLPRGRYRLQFSLSFSGRPYVRAVAKDPLVVD